MRKTQSSLTAAGIALVRAIESEKKANERICHDPYARQFVPAWMYHIFGFFIKSGYAEWRGPGVNGFLAIRERYIDDVLIRFLEEGLEQLVILGAGYDSRPYRFDLPGRVITFEVDHPTTQLDKLKKVQTIFGKLPEHVNFVAVDFNTQKLDEQLLAVDFNTQKLDEQLLAAGFARQRKTLFIWQGVSMYLTAKAVDDTLKFVVIHCGPGSAIVFDYIYRAVLDGDQKQNEVINMHRYRFMTGEELTFGITEGEVEEFLKARGYRQVEDVNIDDLKSTYLTGKNAGRKVVGGYGIVIGRV